MGAGESLNQQQPQQQQQQQQQQQKKGKKTRTYHFCFEAFLACHVPLFG